MLLDRDIAPLGCVLSKSREVVAFSSRTTYVRKSFTQTVMAYNSIKIVGIYVFHPNKIVKLGMILLHHCFGQIINNGISYRFHRRLLNVWHGSIVSWVISCPGVFLPKFGFLNQHIKLLPWWWTWDDYHIALMVDYHICHHNYVWEDCIGIFC